MRDDFDEGIQTDMAQTEITCSKCGSGEYQLLNAQTGEVTCRYCHNQWIVSALIRKTETEKFLEEQAKQPRIIQDNTTETDKQLMDMVSGLAGAGTNRTLNKVVRTVVIVAAIIIILIVACLLVNIFGGLKAIFG